MRASAQANSGMYENDIINSLPFVPRRLELHVRSAWPQAQICGIEFDKSVSVRDLVADLDFRPHQELTWKGYFGVGFIGRAEDSRRIGICHSALACNDDSGLR